jgi:hypothetical protein
MTSDITLAVGDGARRMTYAELAAVRDISALSAERLARRRRWPRQVGNDGIVRVLVPPAEVRKSSENRRVSGPGDPPRIDLPEITEVIREVIYEAIETSAPYDPRTVRTLESAIEALGEQLATERHRCGQAEARAARAERRVEELRTVLADARSAEQIAAGEAAWLRALRDEQWSWRLLRRLRWALRPVLVILLASAILPVQASSAPHEPYTCRLYVDAHRQCAFGSCDDRRLHRLKQECLRDGGGQP